ncbi:hypothetical protein [Tychonema sp. LEGE 07203]|uniref:hypothetical protein n=1 Tax=Tychonema sp. LEGE 07203 TaxID=1828671 RepID=UPI0018817A2A|nr:hypothetical protein [Tychonema sp. LEGE 07203]MBE9097770.1 hypothetical protein [Tychonema sp. LEGE 07203]
MTNATCILTCHQSPQRYNYTFGWWQKRRSSRNLWFSTSSITTIIRLIPLALSVQRRYTLLCHHH